MIRGVSLSALIVLLSSILLLSCSETPSGKEVFTREFCPACHYFRGLGRADGIDISAVGERRSPSWIREHIINPRSHNPNIGMPSHAHLSRAEVGALVAMLTSLVLENP